MLFNSYQFLIFFPIVVLIYLIIPKKARKIWLLIASYYYYMCWNAKYVILIVISTLLTYFCGLLIEKINDTNYSIRKQQNLCKSAIGICIVANLGMLGFFKYFSWIIDNMNAIFGSSIMLPFNIILPVGISFYTFQVIGYMIDLYRGKIKAERNFLRYALFVSFFPKLVAGPIERSENLLKQLNCDKDVDYKAIKEGLLLMIWGFFEKIVIADKAAIFVDSVFGSYTQQEGSMIMLAVILFTFQIYCDFGGYSHIAIGAAKVFGIDLLDNFRQPYFALNIKEFWKRWHISLSSWFKDYLYIPLGGNRCSRVKKFRNLFITFLISGLWHGASWHYVVWGGLHGFYQIISDLTVQFRSNVVTGLRIKTDCFSYRLFRRMITFTFVTFAWLFFRADSIKDAFLMCKKIVIQFNPTILLGDAIYLQGLNEMQMRFLYISLMILLCVDILHEKEKFIYEFMEQQNLLFRWLVYYTAALFLIISVIQTFGQDIGTFIYSKF